MILVILGICIALIVAGFLLIDIWEIIGGSAMVVGCVGAVIGIIAAIVIWINCAGLVNIDKKIDMYVEENTKIETQLAECVKQYQNYEQDTFEKVSPENAATLITLYPELKSDSLVQKQIETYITNNEKIKELRLQQIDAGIIRWWGYFGK